MSKTIRHPLLISQTWPCLKGDWHGEGFCIGNIIKYAQRFGKKDGRNDKDLYKVIHYAIILLGNIQEERERAFIDYDEQIQMDMDWCLRL